MSNELNPKFPAANEHESAPEQKPISPRLALVGTAVVLIILAALAGVGILSRIHADTKLAEITTELAPPTVMVAPAKPGVPMNTLVLPGNVTALTDSPIYARTSGYLTCWYFDIGSRVKKGALLAEIATPEVDQQLAQAEADLNTAQANANNARIQAERYTGLVQSNAVSRQDTDTFVNQAAATAAAVQLRPGQRAAAARTAILREGLRAFRRRHHRPQRRYRPVDRPRRGQGTLPSPGHPDPARLRQSAADLLADVRRGAKIDLIFAEHAGKIYQGTLVRTSDAIDPASRTLLVEMDVDNRAGELLPGSLAQVHFKTPPAGPTFIVPAAALIFRKEGLRVGPSSTATSRIWCRWSSVRTTAPTCRSSPASARRSGHPGPARLADRGRKGLRRQPGQPRRGRK